MKKVKSKYKEMKALIDKMEKEFWDRYDKGLYKAYKGKKVK